MMTDRMQQAYEAGRLLFRARAQREGQRLDDLDDLPGDLILCIAGTYDRVETVLDVLGLEYRVVRGSELGRMTLTPEQVVFVNCPGSSIQTTGLRRLAAFVHAGGTLVTTDWALKHVIERAFPGILAYNGCPTCGGPDECVRIRIAKPDDPVVQGVTDTGEDPVWWLEPSSYPVKVLAPDRVEVLIDSDEMGARYGERPIMVRFAAGKGIVYHMVSHYYLQRAETGSQRATASASTLLTEAGLPPETAESFADVKIAEVEAAYSSARVMYNLISEARRRGRFDQHQRGSKDSDLLAAK